VGGGKRKMRYKNTLHRLAIRMKAISRKTMDNRKTVKHQKQIKAITKR